MENIEIARALEELADLLEIQGANPFRIRAYRNAVRTIRDLTRPLSAMVEEGADLTELPAIGRDMDGYIRELVSTARLERLEEVAREVPRELATLTRLDAVGPKKARKLWEELGVTTVDELEDALKAGRVEALEGFGRKSVEKTLRSIEDYRRRQGRFLRTDAEKYVRPLVEHLRSAPGVRRLEVAGSYRRRKETVGDIDILLLLDGGEVEEAGGEGAGPGTAARAVMERFTTFRGVARVEMSGETRGSVILASGLPVDLRILPPHSYGAALHYFTGSKEHNVAIRKLGVRKGLRISEYGVFRVEKAGADPGGDGGAVAGNGAGSDAAAGEAREGHAPEDDRAGEEAGAEPTDRGERIGGAREEEVFEAVDLPFIPPVLRENRGEIEAAREGTLPDLVTLDDIRGDLHMHTTWSDGRESIRTMAEACRDRGYEYMAVTDHSRAVTVAGGLGPDEIREQGEELRRVRDEVEGIRVLHGCEVDILKDGTLDLPDDVLDELDLVLVAVHSHMALTGPEMTERVLRALEHPAVDILVHPTGRLLTRRDPYALDVDAVLRRAAERGAAVELNANPYRLDLNDAHLKRARELGVRVSVGTDAHRVAELDQMGPGLEQARRGWLEAADVVNAMPADSFLEWLERER